MTIGDARVAQFVEGGFLVVPGLLDADERAEILDDADRFARGEYPVVTPGGEPLAGTDAGDILAIHFPHWASDVMRKAVLHPRVTGVVRRIAGAHLAHWDGKAK